MNKNIDEDFAIDLDILETPHGIFTSNPWLGLKAREVYEQYLHELENPKPPKPSLEEVVKEQEDKISILESENKSLQESQDIQDRTLIETDMKMMDIEWALEDLIVGINPTLENKINLEVFTMKLFEKGLEKSAVYFNQLKQMIERKNYDSVEEMERILNKYRSGRNPRITEEEYDQLFDMLHPPKYEISILPAE